MIALSLLLGLLAQIPVATPTPQDRTKLVQRPTLEVPRVELERGDLQSVELRKQELRGGLASVGHLEQLRAARATASSRATERELGQLLQRFDAGELDLAGLDLASEALSPDAARTVQSVVVAAPEPSQRLSLTPLGAVATTAPLEARVYPLGRGSVFVDVSAWTNAASSQNTLDAALVVRSNGERIEALKTRAGFELAAGESVVVRDAAPPKLGLESEPLCKVVRNLGAAAATPRRGAVRVYEVYHRATNTALQWDAEREAFGTTVYLKMVDAESDAAEGLDPPVEAAVGASGASVRATPSLVSFASTPSSWLPVELVAARHDAEQPALLLSVERAEFAFPFEVEAVTDHFELVATPREVWGFGLGEAVLTVKRMAQDGGVHYDDAELTAALDAESGSLGARSVWFPPGVGSVEGVALRSKGLGADVVQASEGERVRGSARVRYAFPWGLLFACVAGGAAGAWLKRGKPDSGAPGAPLRSAVAAGVLLALVVVTGVLTGLTSFDAFPASRVGSTAGAFVLAVLTGYVGRRVLDKWVERSGLA